MTKNELLLLSSCITALSSQPDAQPKIQSLLLSLFDHHSQKADFSSQKNFKWKPNKKEILSMPDKFRNCFIHKDQLICYRLRKDNVFEIRYDRKGVKINVSSKNFEVMKQKFIQALQDYQTPNIKSPASVLFNDFADGWFLNVKKPIQKESTFKEDYRLFNHDIVPAFKDKFIADVDREFLQLFLKKSVDENKLKKASSLHRLLRCILAVAADDFGFTSPMKNVTVPNYTVKKGKAFSKREEALLIDFCRKNPDKAAASALLVLLYFGLRQSELKTIRFLKQGWLTCDTSKEKLGNDIVPRDVPFTPMVRQNLSFIDFDKAKNTNSHTIATTLKRLFPNHHPHELRYTYITRCKECGVNPEVVMLWDGHSQEEGVKASRVDLGYTDYSEEYLQKESEKVFYTLPDLTDS